MSLLLSIAMPIIRAMTYEQIIKHFGTQSDVAEALNIKQPSVASWKSRGVPLLRQMQIQLVTGGLLQAEIFKRAEA